MEDINEWSELKKTLNVFGIWAVASIVDAFFIVLWVSIQWLSNHFVIEPLQLYGVDRVVLSIFQYVLGISTAAPVILTVYRDITIMFLRTQRRIRKEIALNKVNETNED